MNQMPKVRPILLAEDNPNDVELTLAALHSSGLANEINVVNDGEEALEYLFCRGRYAGRVSGPPATILLDLKMPKLDGLEVLRQIRADPLLRLVPIVMLTSSREDQDLHHSYDLGANAFVVKPVNFEDFIPAISRLGAFWAVINEPPPSPKTPAP
jgi:CheY-like chemotaxis protein